MNQERAERPSLRVPQPVFVTGFLLATTAVLHAWWTSSWAHFPSPPVVLASYIERDLHWLIPSPTGLLETWARVGTAILILATLALASRSAGAAALRWFTDHDLSGLDRGLVVLGLGTGIAGTLVLALGLAGLLRPPLLWLPLLAAASVSLGPLLRGGRILQRARGTPAIAGTWFAGTTWPGRLLLAFCALVGAGHFLAAAGPEWFVDSLVYHLADPEQFLLERKVFYLSDSSNLPFLQEMLYTLLLGLGSQAACNLLHFSQGCLAAVAAYALTREFAGRTAGLVAAAAFMSQPVLRLLQHVTMVELGLAFHEALALIAFLAAWRKAERGGRAEPLLALAGCFLGFAHATKLLGSFCTLLLAGAWLFSGPLPGRRRAGGTAVLAAFAVIGTLPWLAKSWIFTGSAVFPFLQGWFQPFNWTTELYREWLDANLGMGLDPSNWRNWPWIPLRVSTEHLAHGSFTLNPFFLLFLPWLFLVRGASPRVRLMASYCALYTLLWAATSRQARYLIPMAVPGSACVAYIVARSALWGGAVRLAVGFAVAAVLAVSTHGHLFVMYSDQALWPYATGHLSWETILANRVPQYSAMREIRRRVAPRDRVLFLQGGETYYCGRRRLRNSELDRPSIGRTALASRDAAEFARRLRGLRITHVFVDRWREDGFVGLSRTGLRKWPAAAGNRVAGLWSAHLRPVYAVGGYVLFELDPEPLPESERPRGRPAYLAHPRFYEGLRESTPELRRAMERKPAKALRAARAMVNLAPRTAHAHVMLGHALRRLGRDGEAIEQYREAVRLGHPPSAVHARLAELLERRGDRERALAHALEARRLNPDASPRLLSLLERLQPRVP